MENSGNKVVYALQIQTPYRKYKSYTKEFNDQNHFNNWYSYMSGKGYKIIGCSKVETNAV